jgi:hypothetical protein
MKTATVSATTALPRCQGRSRCPEPVSEINGAQPGLSQGSANGSLHGTPAWLCPRLHHRPPAAPSGRRPGARRLLPGVRRDGELCHADRPVLEQVLDQLRPGHTLVIWKLDRLGRSLRHLVDTITELAERGIGFRSLQKAINTTTPGGKLVFHVFAALAEFERDLIPERTTRGFAVSVATGIPRWHARGQSAMAPAGPGGRQARGSRALHPRWKAGAR